MRNEMEYLDDELNRKLSELKQSEIDRAISMAVADSNLKVLTNDIDLLNKRVAEILTMKQY